MVNSHSFDIWTRDADIRKAFQRTKEEMLEIAEKTGESGFIDLILLAELEKIENYLSKYLLISENNKIYNRKGS